jgi:HSP20 family protein
MANRLPTLVDDVVTLRDAMDRFFAESVTNSPFRTLWSSTWNGNGAARMPLPLDVYATKDEAVLVASLPGVQPEAVEITINQNTVTVAGKVENVAASEEAKDATWYLHELAYGSFSRSLTLPFEIDAARADATFEHGILKLTLPKAEAAKPKQIKVRVGAGAPEQAIEAGQPTEAQS